jgi:hypothetical protein
MLQPGHSSSKSDLEKRSYLFLLTTFLAPRTAENLPSLSPDEWERLLGEDPLTMTERFVEKDLVVRSPLARHMEVKFSVAELKNLLHQQGLPVSGRKDELIRRLIQADYEGMWDAVSGLTLLECSKRGAELAEHYLRNLSSQDEKSLVLNLQTPARKLRSCIKWILITAASGVIGDATYDAFLKLMENLGEAPQLKWSVEIIQDDQVHTPSNREVKLSRSPFIIRLRLPMRSRPQPVFLNISYNDSNSQIIKPGLRVCRAECSYPDHRHDLADPCPWNIFRSPPDLNAGNCFNHCLSYAVPDSNHNRYLVVGNGCHNLETDSDNHRWFETKLFTKEGIVIEKTVESFLSDAQTQTKHFAPSHLYLVFLVKLQDDCKVHSNELEKLILSFENR